MSTLLLALSLTASAADLDWLFDLEPACLVDGAGDDALVIAQAPDELFVGSEQEAWGLRLLRWSGVKLRGHAVAVYECRGPHGEKLIKVKLCTGKTRVFRVIGRNLFESDLAPGSCIKLDMADHDDGADRIPCDGAHDLWDAVAVCDDEPAS